MYQIFIQVKIIELKSKGYPFTTGNYWDFFHSINYRDNQWRTLFHVRPGVKKAEIYLRVLFSYCLFKESDMKLFRTWLYFKMIEHKCKLKNCGCSQPCLTYCLSPPLLCHVLCIIKYFSFEMCFWPMDLFFWNRKPSWVLICLQICIWKGEYFQVSKVLSQNFLHEKEPSDNLTCGFLLLGFFYLP